MSLNQAQNEVFRHFVEFGSYVFPEIGYNDSLRQCLISSRGKTHEKILFRPKFGPNGTKSSPKLGFSPFSQVILISFLLNYIGRQLELCLLLIEVKLTKNFLGPKIGSEIRFSVTFSSLHHQFSLILHRIAALDNV